MTKKNVIRLFAVVIVIAIAVISVYAEIYTYSDDRTNYGIKGKGTLQVHTDDNTHFIGTTNVSLSATAVSSNPTYSTYSAIITLYKHYSTIIGSHTGTIDIGGTLRYGKSATEMYPLEITSVTAKFNLRAIATVNGQNTIIDLGITPSVTCP